MTTGWGAGKEPWEAPRIAWALARETAAGRGAAAAQAVPAALRGEVIIALGAQVSAALHRAALRGPVTAPDPMTWEPAVPCAPVRELAAAATGGELARVPPRLCQACALRVLLILAVTVITVLEAAGMTPEEVKVHLAMRAALAR